MDNSVQKTVSFLGIKITYQHCNLFYPCSAGRENMWAGMGSDLGSFCASTAPMKSNATFYRGGKTRVVGGRFHLSARF